MPHGDVAVGKVVAICGFGRLDSGAISDETSVPLVSHEFGFLLLRAVLVPLRPEALFAAVDVGPLGEVDAAVGPCRPAAVLEAVAIFALFLAPAGRQPRYGPPGATPAGPALLLPPAGASGRARPPPRARAGGLEAA